MITMRLNYAQFELNFESTFYSLHSHTVKRSNVEKESRKGLRRLNSIKHTGDYTKGKE